MTVVLALAWSLLHVGVRADGRERPLLGGPLPHLWAAAIVLPLAPAIWLSELPLAVRLLATSGLILTATVIQAACCPDDRKSVFGGRGVTLARIAVAVAVPLAIVAVWLPNPHKPVSLAAHLTASVFLVGVWALLHWAASAGARNTPA